MIAVNWRQILEKIIKSSANDNLRNGVVEGGEGEEVIFRYYIKLLQILSDMSIQTLSTQILKQNCNMSNKCLFPPSFRNGQNIF